MNATEILATDKAIMGKTIGIVRGLQAKTALKIKSACMARSMTQASRIRSSLEPSASQRDKSLSLSSTCTGHCALSLKPIPT